MPELREVLGHWFENVKIYQLGAVSGGLIFEDSSELGGVEVEGVNSTLSVPEFTRDLPVTPLVLTVCGDAEIPTLDRPHLLLDLDRRVFEEYEDRVEDAQLLREEIQRMQETEVQAFQDALKLRRSEISYLKAREQTLQNQTEILRAKEQALQSRTKTLHDRNTKLKKRLQELENSRTWQLLAPYRDLRSRLKFGRR